MTPRFSERRFLSCRGMLLTMKLTWLHPRSSEKRLTQLFLAEEQDYGESVDAIERAIQVLKKVAVDKPQAEMLLAQLSVVQMKEEQRAALKAEYEREKAEREALRPEWYTRKMKKQEDKEKSQRKVKEKK